MPLLSEYEERTAWKYEPIHGAFHTHEGLARKVGPDGSYIPFAGSTVVFRPGKRCLRVVRLMQRVLHGGLEGMDILASPLPASTIHMTLHDLISPEMCVSDPEDGNGYGIEVANSLNRAAAAVEEIRKTYAGRKITMVSDRIVNMVSKSLVLMLKPRTEQDYELLLEWYHRFDGIQKLPYPLTPHITLAYFRPGMLDGESLGRAVDAAQISPGNAPVFEFDPLGLTAQYFRDMQTYLDIPERICFCCDGGLNRSVMVAGILNHLAQERGLPIRCEARSAYQNTQGRPVPEQVWKTLEENGIQPDRTNAAARYLEEEEFSHFTDFAEISTGAADRFSWLGLPPERMEKVSRFFFGVRDPEFGEISFEQAFRDLWDRAERYLDAFENDPIRNPE